MPCIPVKIYYPGRGFPSLSVTGHHCALRCKHCNARYLQHMIPILSPEALIEFAKRNEGKIKGFLLSGGSTPEGKVPLRRFVGAVRWIVENTSLLVNIHTGIIDDEDIEYLEEMSPHHISFDVIGSTETIREVLGIPRTREDYFHALDLLEDSSLHYSPHIIAGLHFGKVLGEYAIVDKLKNLRRYHSLVLLTLIPTKGTPMENVSVDREAVVEFFEYALENIPPEKVVLGCMRPRNFHDLENLCLSYSCRGMVLPSLRTIKKMREIGIPVETRDTCCVF